MTRPRWADKKTATQLPAIAQNWLDLRAERGLSSFDQRHLASLQMQYSTGMGLRGGTLLGGWRGGLFKDWTFATQITAGSGLAQTPIYLAPVEGTGVTGTIRPDYTGASLYAAPGGLYLNPAAYAAAAAGPMGKRRPELHYRPRTVHPECLPWPHLPARRPA